MNRNRTADALPGRSGSQADHSTKQEIHKRTPDVGPGGSIIHTPSGVFIEQKRTGAKYVPPWKVSSKGDGTVRITPGKAFNFTNGPAGEGASMVAAVEYAGTQSFPISETGASYVYAEIPVASAQVVGATSYKQLSSTVTIVNDVTVPALMDTTSNVYLLLATVDKTDGVVTITKQHLEHSPIIQLAAVGTHPWQVTENGDNTVDVAAGRIMYPAPDSSGSLPNSPYTVETEQYAGGTVTITGSGTLYAVCAIVWQETADDTTYTLWSFHIGTTGAPTVARDPTPTGDEIIIPIATVDLTAGIATVTEQILNYNPIMQLGYVQNYFS